jgi:hypothetical protein
VRDRLGITYGPVSYSTEERQVSAERPEGGGRPGTVQEGLELSEDEVPEFVFIPAEVAVFTGEVQQNQRLWDLLYNGILHSVVAGGAETNRIARRALKLPAPSAPGEHR